MKDKVNVLVTGVGGPTPRSFVRAVIDSGCDSYRFIGVDSNPLAIGLYDENSFVAGYVVPPATDRAYWSYIEKIVKDHNVKFAVVMPEIEVIEWSKAIEVGVAPCESLISAPSPLSDLVDKKRLHEVLEGEEYIPRYYTFESGGDVKSAPLNYPFWVRATFGSSGLGSLKVNSAKELDEWVNINPSVKEFIASEFLPGRNLACKLIYKDGVLLRSACAERKAYIMSKVAPSGITGNTSFGRMVNDSRLVEISEHAINTIFSRHEAMPHGVFTVDFKENSNGVPMITEINVRFVAFASSLAKAGANLPLDYLDANLRTEGFCFDRKDYKFPDGTIFLRDVDENPVVMNERELLKLEKLNA